jgi:hypothetical protein
MKGSDGSLIYDGSEGLRKAETLAASGEIYMLPVTNMAAWPMAGIISPSCLYL